MKQPTKTPVKKPKAPKKPSHNFGNFKVLPSKLLGSDWPRSHTYNWLDS